MHHRTAETWNRSSTQLISGLLLPPLWFPENLVSDSWQEPSIKLCPLLDIPLHKEYPITLWKVRARKIIADPMGPLLNSNCFAVYMFFKNSYSSPPLPQVILSGSRQAKRQQKVFTVCYLQAAGKSEPMQKSQVCEHFCCSYKIKWLSLV